MYAVFTRTWWRKNPSYPGGREPHAGRRRYLARDIKTETEALVMCKRWNESHKPGPLSRKAEYEET